MKINRVLAGLLVGVLATSLYAQNLSVPLLRATPSDRLVVDEAALLYRLEAPPQVWELVLPAVSSQEELRLRLHPNDLLAEDFRLREVSTARTFGTEVLGRHYLGEIAGEPGSQVAVSLLPGELIINITRVDGERVSLEKVSRRPTHASESYYALRFEEEPLLGRELACATADSGKIYPSQSIRSSTAGGRVDVYFEVDYDIYYDRGGTEAAAAHLIANFNEVTALYASIGVELRISEMLVWDRVSPYVAETSRQALAQFQRYRPTYRGDVAQLVSYQASGGIAVPDGLCDADPTQRMSFASIEPSFAAVPVYSWSTMVIAHELGHLLGSQHTHACVWNGNGTAIDGCAGLTEGDCGLPGVPTAGGTIMSYCHLRSVGVNFINGFGPQPSAVIANRVADAQPCLGYDLGGCAGEETHFSLTLDDFGPETSWLLRDRADGRVLYRGGPYAKKQSGRIVKDTFCLRQLGCYDLEVLDSDGDGLCCGYGTGGWLLTTSTGRMLGQGNGQFTGRDRHSFCLESEEDEEDYPEEDDEEDHTDCPTISFSPDSVLSFGTNQDEGYWTLGRGGRQLNISGNAWKAIEWSYQVTEATYLSFWFRSERRGDVHGIGLDNNFSISPNLTFKLYGTQTWGIEDYADYPADGQWRYYSIPLGEHYTGKAEYVFFVADHDVEPKNADSQFRDVRLTEGPCRARTFQAEYKADRLGPGGPRPFDRLKLFPNPADREVTVQWPNSGYYRILNATGRSVIKGRITKQKNLTLSTSYWPSGTYLLQFLAPGQSTTRRFTVVH